MKTLLLVFFGLIANLSGFSQDTISIKNGSPIEAKVTEIGTTVIKYKKFENRETSPVYSILKSDVLSIKYEDGTIDSFTTVPKEIEESPKVEQVSSEETSDTNNDDIKSKLYFGAGFSLVNSYNIGNVLDFWQNMNDDTRTIEQATGFFIFKVGSLSKLNEKNWLGVECQFGMTPSHSIWGTNLFYGGRNEIYYSAMFLNIALSYAGALDKNNKIFFVIEPGLDLGTMTGSVSINNYYYEQSLTFGIGGHGAVGLDFIMGKNFTTNLRCGYRFMTIDETHQDDNSDTGFSSFYVNGSSGETVKVDWSGLYMTLGASISINKKRK
jgi:hypothetical protein